MGKKIFKGWHHYGVLCQNIEESISYYKDVMGFEFLFQCGELEGDDHIKLAFMKLDTLVLELLEPVSWNKEACEWAKKDMNHLCLAVGDLIATKEKLEKEFGIEWEGEIEDTPEYKALFWHGPGGERLEMFQFMPGSPLPQIHTKTDNPYFQGLAHIGYFTADLEKSIEFYCNVLGFELDHMFEEVDPNYGTHYRIAFFKQSNVIMEVIQSVVHPVISEMIPYPARMNMNHFGMEVSGDMQEAIDYIRSQYNVEWENTTPGISPDIGEGNDMQWALFRGPNGERWELSKDLGKNY